MSHDVGNDTGGGGILANKMLWMIVGAGIFVVVGFLLPTPQSVVDIVDKYGSVSYTHLTLPTICSV